MAITILSVVLLVLGLVGMTGTVTWVLMRGNNTRLTRLFVTCQCSVMVWLISQLMILFSVTHKQLWFSYIIGNIGISTFAPFWLMFSFEYADVRTWLKKAGIALPVISAAAVACVVSNPVHKLYYASFEKGHISYGKMFYIFQILYYVFILAGICVIFIKHSRGGTRMTRQSMLLALATAVPLFINTLSVTHLIETKIEITPLFFTFSVIVILIAISRYGLLNINRIAINETVDNISSAVMVFDTNDIMTYKNRCAETLIKCENGTTYSQLLKEIEHKTGTRLAPDFSSSELKAGNEYFNIRQNYCTNKKGVHIARIIMLTNVSEYYELLDTEKKLSLEQERNRIAQEIHDSAGHTFTMISSLSRIIDSQLKEKNVPDEVLEYVSEIDGLSRSGVTQLRCSINNLRDDEFMTSVTRAISTVTSAVRGIDIDLCVQGEEDESFEFCIKEIYDNTRESITNSMRYSGADRIDVILKFLSDRLELYIFDNGKGCSSIKENNGLRGIRARTEALGGTVRFNSVEGEGFTTIVKIPKRKEGSDDKCNNS